MRKQVFGRQFKRTKNQRKALFNGLISSMILKGSITTTEEKAKSIKGDLEKLVTKAKKQKKELLSASLKPFEVEKMLNEIGPSFAERNGGYTRIIKTGKRFNDNASMVILQWVEREEVTLPKKEAPKKAVADKKEVKKATPKKAAKKTIKKDSSSRASK